MGAGGWSQARKHGGGDERSRGVMNRNDKAGCGRSGVGGLTALGGGACQLANLSAFRLVDLLGSRKVGELAGRGGFLVYPGGVRRARAVVWLVCR